jgi:peptidoglycan-N-acetylglucosamine deacetylase
LKIVCEGCDKVNHSRRDVLKLIGLVGGTTVLGKFNLADAQTIGSNPRPPLPGVQPPGATQPLAPGYRRAAPLPQLTLEPPIPGVRKIEYASNGFIEVAHALILEGKAATGVSADLELAQRVVQQSFLARPSLSEVDLSIYASGTYDGIGGTLPRFTANVPKVRLEAFLKLSISTLSTYDRAWLNPNVMPPRKRSEDTLEQNPVFYGPPDKLRGQQVKQLSAQLSGGVRGGLYFHGNPNKPFAALSFDDAPHPLYEPLLLDTLRRAGVQATFFVIGRNAVAYPYFVRDMVAGGHEVGNHTFHHVRLPPLSDADVKNELEHCNKVLQSITGQPVQYFRPPGGDYSAATLKIASSLGLTTTFWTDDPGDFDNPGEAVIESRLTRKLRAGGIVLLHDNVLQSIQVLPAFLNVAKKRQIALVTVGRLDASDGRR